MDFDEYEYLEKAVEEPEARKDKDRSGSRRHKDRGEDGEGRASKRSRPEEQNGDKRDRVERERDNDRAKDRRKSGRDSEKERDKDRDYRSREREYKDRDKGRERDSGKERERGKEKDKKRERERDKEKERDRSASRSRRDAERDRSASRSRRDAERDRSASRSRRDAESEMETARSKERREPELEREIHERESRRVKDKKDAEPEVDPERDQRTVFAYQMPLKANERDAYEFFSQAGKVRDVRLIMDRNSRRSKGVGYIEFYDVMSVPLAIALSGQLLLGQPVMVKPSEAEKNLVQSTATAAGVAGAAERKIYVGNLHYNITEEQLRQIFEPFGTVELVQLPLDETGHCRGYGFIQFAQLDHVKAAQSLNGKLDIAGRIIKVSAVTDHVTVQETGTSAVDFDDEDGGGLSLNARSRAMLMQKLDRTGTASSIAESLGVPILNGAVPIQQPLSVPALSINPSMISVQQIPATVETSECLLLTNMFDPSTETEPDFELDIKEDVQEECSKYGRVKHIFVDKNSNGHVYLRFESVTAASICQRAMQGRWFAGRSVSATYMRQQDYEAKVGRD
ncbi:RNA-binding protein 39-like isoform X1 [Zingiber officinale]|uniref:RNA-binding protein 39-like isoform X1 n=1 Tax=Zingiber officinale TaxID=94328 RepID=UPI001C4B3E8F|nr:RNA-binding protein 39-like isoform X1 [Zingiber officinale]